MHHREVDRVQVHLHYPRYLHYLPKILTAELTELNSNSVISVVMMLFGGDQP